MGMPAAAPRIWTVAEVLELPDDGNRYEVVGGELLVSPSPRFDHQEAVMQLWSLLTPYLREHLVGHAAVSPADIEFSPIDLVQPDVFVVPLVNGKRPRNWSDVTALVLAAEVLSPSSARADRVLKRALYRRQRVSEYWVVDTNARVVERWRPDDERPEIVEGMLTWQPVGAAMSLAIDLPAYFAQVLDAAD